MKLHLTIAETPPSDPGSRGWAHHTHHQFDYDDTNDVGTTLTPAEIQALVQLWAMAATESSSVTQSVIDELTARLRQTTTTLRAAVASTTP